MDNEGNFVVNDFQNSGNSDRDIVQEKLEQSSSSYQFLSQAEFTDDKIAKNNQQRDQITDKSDKKKVDGNKSGGPLVEQVTMGNAFGSSSSRETGESMSAAAAAVKTIDRISVLHGRARSGT